MQQFQCGPSANEEFSGYETEKRFSYFVQIGKRKISGTGAITTCHASNISSSIEEDYVIEEGITELSDSCFSGKSIRTITLPLSLKKIGNNCFTNTKIKQLSLPPNIESIGSNNLPSSLQNFTIPANLAHIDVNNFDKCENLTAIYVDEGNNQYTSIDGILYNKDLTTILRCPQCKTGDVVIPPTVKKIEEYCFSKCTKLTAIVIPSSVIEIGKFAFSGLNINNLRIPNSVLIIGESCFESCTITNEFCFSSCVETLPEKCFASANIPFYGFTRNIRHFHKDCFAGTNFQNRRLPSSLDLRKATHLGCNSISLDKRQPSFVALYSNLTQIDNNAIACYGDSLTIRVFSYTPFRINSNAFINLQNSKLIVPPGTKLIFQHTHPWSVFSNIEEKPIDEYSSSTDKVDESTLLFRIKSIIDSIKNVDRFYLQENIDTLSISYQEITTDVQYEEAIKLFKYNKKFSPSIIERLEEKICPHWDYKYRLKLIQENLISQSAPLSFSLPESEELHKPEETHTLPLSPNSSDLSIPLADEDIHFENILKYLQNELSIAQENVKIAVSWFTNFALFSQIREMALDGIRIQLLTNNDSINNGGYCLDLNQLINAGVEISLIEYPHLLHDKFCIIDDKTVINGSYNWTRFSEKNYENMMVIRNNPKVVKAFSAEFDRLWNMAELKDIDEMPETVQPKPEYDRLAFKQYITEELDAEAKESSDDRSRITASQKAHQLNPDYHYKLNPQYTESPEQKEVIEDSIAIGKAIAQKVAGKPIHAPLISQGDNFSENTITPKSKPSHAVSQQKLFHAPQSSDISRVITKEEQKHINKVKASSLFLALDVSGSMKETFKNGHVHNIAKQALSSALALSDSPQVSIWTFGNSARHTTDISLSNFSDITNIKCENTGTNLNTFIHSASPLMQSNTLVIIFTDDDGSSIAGAIAGMKNRKDVFWQIISYEQNCGNIRRSINAMKNASLITLHDYANRSKEEIQSMLVEGYVKWRAGV